MNKFAILILTFTCLSICKGQSVEEINTQARDLLTKGDTKNAVPLLKKAAELGHPEAQYNYGVCFQQGVEVEKNDSVANIWLLKSAAQGWVDAQFKVAYSYSVGRGFKKDYQHAFYWSLKCAEQNDTECLNSVINCYMQGWGTEKNLDSALIWTIYLASLPDVENLRSSGIITGARKFLAEKYRDGDATAKDNVSSYMWFLIYNESKRDFSILEQQRNIDAIKELEKNLTQTDKDTAKSQAEVQIKRKLKNLANLYKQEY